MSRFFRCCMRLFGSVGASLWRRTPTFGHAMACVSFLGLVSLIYTSGAAAMYFGLPTSNYFCKMFMGSEEWFAKDKPQDTTPGTLPEKSKVAHGSLADAYQGYTLITTSDAPEALLIDMQGTVVHRWRMPYREPWPRAAHVRAPLPEEQIHWERAYLYPNGDLLALCAYGAGAPYGYGLARFDKDSKLLWGYSACVHHAFDVGDDGRIYLLTTQHPTKMHKEVRQQQDLSVVPDPAEELVVLSPEGRELDKIPLYETIHDSPYFLLFNSALEADWPHSTPGHSQRPGNPPAPPGSPHSPNGPPTTWAMWEPGDSLHSNSVKVLRKAQASKFPQFRPGMVLLSFRSSGLLAVLDLEPQTRSVAWALKGPWKYQHDAAFLDNGHLLIFDNFGSARWSRVLEYDPVTQAITWSFTGENAPNNFSIPFRGANQRLPNGNTLIVNPGMNIFEVTTNKEIVWEYGLPSSKGSLPLANSVEVVNFSSVRRYGLDDLTFLKDGLANKPN
jgi:hypothetical protein